MGKTLWFRARDFGRMSGMAVLQKFFGKEVLRPESVDHNAIRSILVVRQHDQLGDFLLSTPVLRALREHFPAARIGLVVREYFGEIGLLIPFVDDVLVFRERVFRWSWNDGRAFVRALRGHWDLAIVLNTVSHSLTSDVLAHLSGARFVLGSEGRLFRGSSRNFLYNLLAPECPAGRHQTQCNLDIVRHIGVDTGDYSPKVTFSESESRSARADLEAMGFRPHLPAIAMHLGAGKEPNRWPVTRFAELARSLTGSWHVQIVLFWGPGEGDLRTRFAACAGIYALDAGHPTLRKLAAYCAQCAVIVCNDTGIMHLAAASGVPVVAVFGPTDPDEWKPLGVRMTCLRAPSRKTEDVTAGDAMNALRALVGERLPTLER